MIGHDRTVVARSRSGQPARWSGSRGTGVPVSVGGGRREWSTRRRPTPWAFDRIGGSGRTVKASPRRIDARRHRASADPGARWWHVLRGDPRRIPGAPPDEPPVPPSTPPMGRGRPDDRSCLMRIAFASTYPPRRCGIAMFTSDLPRAIGDREIVALHPARPRRGLPVRGPSPDPARRADRLSAGRARARPVPARRRVDPARVRHLGRGRRREASSTS